MSITTSATEKVTSSPQVFSDANAWSHACAWICALVPLLTGLVFVPQLHSPFLVAKASVFVFCAGVCAGLALLSKAVYTRSQRMAAVWAAAISGIIAMSAALSPLRYMARPGIILILAALVLLLSATVLLRDAIERLWISLRCAAALVSLVAIAQFAFHFDVFRLLGSRSAEAGRMRVLGTLGNPDFCAAFLAACIPACLAHRTRLARWAMVTVTSAAVLMTGSRTGIAAVCAAFLVTFAFQISRRSIWIIVVTIAFTAIALIGIVRWNGRSLTTALEGRLTIWRIATFHVSALGTGPNTFSYIYMPRAGEAFNSGMPLDPRFIGQERHAQNDLVEALTEFGWGGALVIVAAFVAWFRFAIRIARTENHTQIAVATVASLLVCSIFDFPLHRAEGLATLALAMAVPFAAKSTGTQIHRAFSFNRALSATLCLAVFSYFAFTPVIASFLARRGLETETTSAHNAADFYQASLRWDVTNTDAQFSLTRALAQDERYEEALQQSTVALRYVAEPELWLLRARILESMDRNGDARSEVHKALTAFPYSSLLIDELRSIPTEENR